MPTILDRDVGSIGYGLMGLTWRADPPSESDCFLAMNTALSCGANFWNGGEFYGSPDYNSLHLLNRFFTAFPEKADSVFLSLKGGLKPGATEPDSSEAGIRRSVDACIGLLDGRKTIDLFQCARTDPNTPIEQVVEVLSKLVQEGKIKGIGLSEVRAETIRRAHKVHPIAAVEVELSLWTRDILTNGIAATCAELGIPIIAYAPLSRGALADDFPTKNSGLPAHRRIFPKFQDDALANNMNLTKEVENLARNRGCSKSQMAIGWVRGLSGRNGLGTIIPIPGAEKAEWVRENCEDIMLSDAEMKALEEILSHHQIVGERYTGELAKLANG